MAAKCPQCRKNLRYVKSINAMICNDCGFSETISFEHTLPNKTPKKPHTESFIVFLKWGIPGICLLLVLLLMTIIFQKTHVINNPKENLTDTSTQPSNKDLLIGKWLYIGSTKYGKSTRFRLEIEYFEDNTYIEKTESNISFLNNNKNGEWIVFSDERLKKTYEDCQVTGINQKCKKIVNVNKISFPDSNTLYVEYENGTDIFKKIY